MSYPDKEYLQSNEYQHDKYWSDKTRELIDRETSLKSNRINWMLTSQSLLFLAFGNLFKENGYVPCLIISFLGLFTTLSYIEPIGICEEAIKDFRHEYEKHFPRKNRGDSRSHHPPIDFDAKSKDKKIYQCIPEWLSTQNLPWMFFVTWKLLITELPPYISTIEP